MGGEHRGRVDDGVAAEGGFFAQVVVDPTGGQAEGGFADMLARQVDLAAPGVHGHQRAQSNLAGAGLHLLDADEVALGIQPHIVEDAHGGHDEAEICREGFAQRLDLVGEATTLQIIDQGQEAVAQLDLDLIDGQGVADRFLGLLGGGRSSGGGVGFGLSGRGGVMSPTPGQDPGAHR